MNKLQTQYLGLRLKNPLVVAASPITRSLDKIKRAVDAGASAIVWHSLFEEQINHDSRELDHFLTRGAESYSEAVSYFPEADQYKVGPEEYLAGIAAAKKAVGIPLIASLNGISPGGWVKHARLMQQAGADALELNLYFLSTDPTVTAETLERNYVYLVRLVKQEITIPLSVKLHPFFTALPSVAQQLCAAGADGLVLFNRFYQPDLDISELKVDHDLTYSTSKDLLLPLRWTAILHGQVPCDLAITSGVHNHEDVIKAMMAGAKVTQIASEILARGVSRLTAISDDLSRWLDEHEYESIAQMQGSMSQRNVAEPAAFERANYIKMLQSWSE
jgi:dihydroorotate dehydrogenase (fumarate)